MEETVVFGKYENLVGTYCGPRLTEPSPLAVLMLTPGMLHHVGPTRLHVQLARRLRSCGIASLRFDLSGIGESLAVGQAGSSLQRATEEAIQAMDWLADTHGIQQFALFGLCSGADDSLAIAQQDKRVIGLSMMDGLGYRTQKFYGHWLLKKHLPRICRISKWYGLLRRRIALNSNQVLTMPLGEDIREFPSHADAERQIHHLLERDVRFQFIYTGGVIDYYSYQDQFTDMFPAFSGHVNIRTRYYPQMDHVAKISADREQLLAELEQWFNNLNNQLAVTCDTVVLQQPISFSPVPAS